MSKDTIYRDDAIKCCRNEWEEEVEERLRLLPSAEPVIIRCKDCKYYAGEGMYCEQNICVQFDHFYCYYGEREEK